MPHELGIIQLIKQEKCRCEEKNIIKTELNKIVNGHTIGEISESKN